MHWQTRMRASSGRGIAWARVHPEPPTGTRTRQLAASSERSTLCRNPPVLSASCRPCTLSTQALMVRWVRLVVASLMRPRPGLGLTCRRLRGRFQAFAPRTPPSPPRPSCTLAVAAVTRAPRALSLPSHADRVPSPRAHDPKCTKAAAANALTGVPLALRLRVVQPK